MTSFKVFASLVLAVNIASTLSAESRCPANVASLPFRMVNRYQMIVPVSINHSGPFSFLLDTGTQMTMVDPALAAALHLETSGKAKVAGVGMQAAASFAQVDLVEAGSHSVANQKVLVYDLANLPATGLDIQGVLGEDFLEQFDMLIDNGHNLLCLDDSAAMRTAVKGSRIPLQTQSADGSQLAGSPIVVARLSDGMRPVRLELDSGSDVPFLYNTSEYMALNMFRDASLHGGSGVAQKIFMALPPQDVRIGSVELGAVSFITLPGVKKNTNPSDFDGLLTMGLFKRVLIDHTDHYVVLETY
ncbi:MAG: retropepsin-like aspartic protease [Acidobacteriaceae bacterium]